MSETERRLPTEEEKQARREASRKRHLTRLRKRAAAIASERTSIAGMSDEELMAERQRLNESRRDAAWRIRVVTEELGARARKARTRSMVDKLSEGERAALLEELKKEV